MNYGAIRHQPIVNEAIVLIAPFQVRSATVQQCNMDGMAE
jgi:hypothetical protein